MGDVSTRHPESADARSRRIAPDCRSRAGGARGRGGCVSAIRVPVRVSHGVGGAPAPRERRRGAHPPASARAGPAVQKQGCAPVRVEHAGFRVTSWPLWPQPERARAAESGRTGPAEAADPCALRRESRCCMVDGSWRAERPWQHFSLSKGPTRRNGPWT